MGWLKLSDHIDKIANKPYRRIINDIPKVRIDDGPFRNEISIEYLIFSTGVRNSCPTPSAHVQTENKKEIFVSRITVSEYPSISYILTNWDTRSPSQSFLPYRLCIRKIRSIGQLGQSIFTDTVHYFFMHLLRYVGKHEHRMQEMGYDAGGLIDNERV
jgi:hypothetical protein